MQIAILGREKSVCRAEFESVFSDFGFISDHIVSSSQEINLSNLGGAIKSAVWLDTVEDIQLLSKKVAKIILESAQNKKISFGLSLYLEHEFNQKVKYKDILISVKNILRSSNINSRFVLPKDDFTVSAAQIKHNRLIDKGVEVIIASQRKNFILAKTLQVQDIDRYSLRDFGRPCRDKKIGMLPPKLAQILINLARPAKDQQIYDPFCGNGVIIQEALLFGYNALGSDISSRMVECSRQNLLWLADNFSLDSKYLLEEKDATKISKIDKNTLIVSEGYLGEIIDDTTSSDKIIAQKSKIAKLYIDFLSNLAKIKYSNNIVICLPVWKVNKRIIRLEIIDQIKNLGYNTKQFKDKADLIYMRENQKVGREILVLNKR
jgi:tRNA G10  N-methylase Trm11